VDYSVINKNICDLADDSHTLRLLKEIELVAGLPLNSYALNTPVIHYLLDVWTKNPICKHDIIKNSDYKAYDLIKKVDKFKNSDINMLCSELAINKSIDYATVCNKTLYVFLRDVFKPSKKTKPKKLACCHGSIFA